MCVLYNEISFLFERYTYYYGEKDLFWYRYMWSVLGKYGLTSYDTDIEYYYVYFRAVALIYMFHGYVSVVDGDSVFPDGIYAECLADVIPAFVLGQLFAKEESNIEDNESYAIFRMAQKEHEKITDAVIKEMSFEDLLRTMNAVSYNEIRSFEDENGDEYDEDWSPESFEEYSDLVSNRLIDVSLSAYLNEFLAYDFVVNNKAYFDNYN